MPKRSRKDFAQTALGIVEQAIGEPLATKKKNPHARSLGRLGGIKGGPARAAKLTPAERTASARKAAIERWKTAKNSGKIKAGS